jgi:hypothetical protein
MNGTECRPQAPVAEGGPESYEGYLGDAPKTLFIFLATPLILPRNPRHLEKNGIHSNEEAWDERWENATGGTDGTGSPGAGGVRAASGRLKSDVKLFNAFVLIPPGEVKA